MHQSTWRLFAQQAARYHTPPYLMIDMGTHMKTTMEISDSLFADARMLAAAEGTTLRHLVESGLRHAITQRKRQAEPFRLRDASFGGHGLVEELKGAPWDQIRDLRELWSADRDFRRFPNLKVVSPLGAKSKKPAG